MLKLSNFGGHFSYVIRVMCLATSDIFCFIHVYDFIAIIHCYNSSGMRNSASFLHLPEAIHIVCIVMKKAKR